MCERGIKRKKWKDLGVKRKKIASLSERKTEVVQNFKSVRKSARGDCKNGVLLCECVCM